MSEIKYGWGSIGSKFYHKLHFVKGYYHIDRWLDCNSWAREPHDSPNEAIKAGLLPCPKCILGKEVKLLIPMKDKAKKSDKLVDKLKKGVFPTREEIYENPIQAIHVDKPTWYGIQGDVLEVVYQFLTGYAWELKFNNNFIAYHQETEEVERLLHKASFLKEKSKSDSEWWPTEDEEIELLLIDFARLVPRMWD